MRKEKKLYLYKAICILFALMTSFLLIGIMSNNRVISAYAEEVTESLDDVINTSNMSLETYTVNVYNGSEGVGAFDISIGDSYTLTQFGYSVNNQFYEYSGKEKMNNCAYGSYYGLPIIDGIVVATYAGWSLNGIPLSTSGVWGDYDVSILNVYAIWNPINFTIELNDDYTNDSIEYVNHFDGITLPTRYRAGYEFKGWETSDGYIYQGGTTLHPNENIKLTAKWEEIFEVRLISSEHRSYDRIWQGTMGETFTLPSLTSGNFYVCQWGTHVVGDEYTITGDATLYAVWRGITYTITYKNLLFMGQTASVVWDNYVNEYVPTEYEYGIGLDLSRVTAYWEVETPYTPQLVFLGWYTDASFNNSKSVISITETGNVELYAKWRYDYSYKYRSGEKTIDNTDPLAQSNVDSISIGLDTTLIQELNRIGIGNLTINLKIRHWGEGTAYLFAYREDNELLWSCTFTPGESDEEKGVYNTQITLALNQLLILREGEPERYSSYIYIRYQASSYKHLIFWTKSHYWYNDILYAEVSYVVEAEDINQAGKEFTWRDRDPLPEELE